MHDEVVDQLAVAVERLGWDARWGGKHVADAELGDEAAQVRDEGALAGGVPDLRQPGSPKAAHQPPGPRPGKVRAEVAGAQPADPVRVAGADHQRRGPEQDLAVDGPGQM